MHPARALTELLQPPQVDAVLGPVLLGGADEEVGFLQDEEGLLPALRVEHALVAQLARSLEFVAQQAVTAHGSEPLWDGTRDEMGKGRAQDWDRSHRARCPAHLADGACPCLQRLGTVSPQLLHFFPSEEELEGEAKPAEDEKPSGLLPPCTQRCSGCAQPPSKVRCPSLPSVCPWAPQPCRSTCAEEGAPWGYLSVVPGLVGAWALLTPRERSSPLSMWPRGSVHFSVSKKSRDFSSEHQTRWKSVGWWS